MRGSRIFSSSEQTKNGVSLTPFSEVVQTGQAQLVRRRWHVAADALWVPRRPARGRLRSCCGEPHRGPGPTGSSEQCYAGCGSHGLVRADCPISSRFTSQLFSPHLTQIYVLGVLEARSPRPRCQPGWFLLRPLSLAGTLRMAVLSTMSQF